MNENKLYPNRYGAWAGNPEGAAPDFTHCCEEVTFYIGRWPKNKQCDRKRGYGPDQAYCKQHDPAAVEKRRGAADARYRDAQNKRRYELYGRTFFDALKKIADGHNDPRTLAMDITQKFIDGEAK